MKQKHIKVLEKIYERYKGCIVQNKELADSNPSSIGYKIKNLELNQDEFLSLLALQAFGFIHITEDNVTITKEGICFVELK